MLRLSGIFLCSLTFLTHPAWGQSERGRVDSTSSRDVVGAIKGWKATDADDLRFEFEVERFTLENGLTVLLHSNRSIPMISYHTWYRVGSRHEGPGYTGAAHMLEHMMFKGAKKYSGEDFDRILHENGISNNAFTTADVTGYYMNLPSSQLELIMDVEVDRMSSLALRPEDLSSELEVVAEERRFRVDNNPIGTLRELLMETLFRVHPYRWPVIGYMEDIQAYTVERLRDFYNKFYGPNNAVLVLAGDFDVPKTRALIKKYYGVLEPRPLPEMERIREPTQRGHREAQVTRDVQAGTAVVAFQGVDVTSEDVYPLDLATQILGGGSSSRLHQRLVHREERASSVSVANWTLEQEGAFAIFFGLRPGDSFDPALNSIFNEVWKLREEQVSEQELQRAKNQVMHRHVESLMTNEGRAWSLASAEVYLGDYQELFKSVERYQAVSAEDILRVAGEYLIPDRRSVVRLIPRGGE